MRSALNIMLTLLLALGSLSMTSCQKSPINGDLDGQWQVLQVDPDPDVKPIEHRIYYCFYMHTCNLTIWGESTWTTSVMSYDGSKLTITFPEDIWEYYPRRLAQYGITRNPVTFDVEIIDGKKMFLRDGDTTVTLRKF